MIGFLFFAFFFWQTQKAMQAVEILVRTDHVIANVVAVFVSCSLYQLTIQNIHLGVELQLMMI